MHSVAHTIIGIISMRFKLLLVANAIWVIGLIGIHLQARPSYTQETHDFTDALAPAAVGGASYSIRHASTHDGLRRYVRVSPDEYMVLRLYRLLHRDGVRWMLPSSLFEGSVLDPTLIDHAFQTTERVIAEIQSIVEDGNRRDSIHFLQAALEILDLRRRILGAAERTDRDKALVLVINAMLKRLHLVVKDFLKNAATYYLTLDQLHGVSAIRNAIRFPITEWPLRNAISRATLLLRVRKEAVRDDLRNVRSAVAEQREHAFLVQFLVRHAPAALWLELDAECHRLGVQAVDREGAIASLFIHNWLPHEMLGDFERLLSNPSAGKQWILQVHLQRLRKAS